MQGIVLTSQIPLRTERSHSSEMISQLLFGETYTVLEKVDNWLSIKTDYDAYSGWINCLSHSELKLYEDKNTEILKSKYAIISDQEGRTIFLSAGSVIGKTDEQDNFTINGNKYHFLFKDVILNYSKLTDLAKSFIGLPYLWGGRTIMGFDCSGFTQVIFKIAGEMQLARDASEQVKTGKTVSIMQEAHDGDLAFFGDEDTITHVGIIIDHDKIIHCSGEVKVNFIDNTGIFDGEKYTHFLRTIKSFQQ
jgi:gamma-D-glutamyl-L-lysine dipeptidyl-peptidase